MKVLIADKFEARGIESLKRIGCRVDCQPDLKGDALRDAVAGSDCEVLVVRSTKVTADILEAGKCLALVVRAGAGYNTIDVQAAADRSILVANCPGKNSIAVAELTFALILAIDRRIVDNTLDLRNGIWNKKKYAAAPGLKGRTLGIVGFGQIGRAVARRARAFEMNVCAWSRSLTDDTAAEHDVTRCDSPADVAGQCDIFSIHLASAPETRNLIDADVLSRLKDGAYVINTARADVLDYDALADAVGKGRLRAGLDVFPNEPAGGTGEIKEPMFNLDGVVYGTHHIGASTHQAQDAIAAETVRVIATFAETGRVLNCVNLRAASEDEYSLRVRHRNEPGVLAHVLGALSHDGINIEEMENIITAGEKGACAHIRLDAEPQPATLEKIQTGHPGVLAVTLTRGNE